MQHLGDIFVDAVSSVADSARKHAKSIVLTYDIRALKKKKRQGLSLIGSRIVQVKKAGLADLTRDDKLVEMIAEIEKIDRVIASFEKKKKTMAGGCENMDACARADACRSEGLDPTCVQGGAQQSE
jgi:hypothetical protein